MYLRKFVYRNINLSIHFYLYIHIIISLLSFYPFIHLSISLHIHSFLAVYLFMDTSLAACLNISSSIIYSLYHYSVQSFFPHLFNLILFSPALFLPLFLYSVLFLYFNCFINSYCSSITLSIISAHYKT